MGFNDDVVIPLMLRSLYPEGVILYPVGEVEDAGHQRRTGWILREEKEMLVGQLAVGESLIAFLP